MGSFSERPVDRVDNSPASYVIEACAASWTHDGLHDRFFESVIDREALIVNYAMMALKADCSIIHWR